MNGEARGKAAGMRCVVTVYSLAKRGSRDEHGKEGCLRGSGGGRSGRSVIVGTCSFAHEDTRGLGMV